jgi:4-hydroxy-3-polyprenylbenzoate decarboxylase
MTTPRRLIIGISGASGVIYGLRLLEVLHGSDIETHLVVSKSAEMTLAYETERKLTDLHALADHVHAAQDVGAAISSGSFRTMGMIVAPCSIRSLAEIAWGTTTSLLTRAADVVLKERRRLVLMVRETPLHLGHLRAMVAATENGAIILPPVPGFYALPASVTDIVDQSVGRALDLFDIETNLVKRWGEAGQGEGPTGKKPRRGLKPKR